MKAPRIQPPKLQAPAFLNNLYRDMRDRRLLLPALALVVALIAVPLALSRSSATTAPPPAPAPGASGSARQAATSPAVLAEQLGVTNYRRRLEQIKSKNPFRLHFTSQPRSAKTHTSSAGATSSTTTGSSSTATTSSTASTSSTSTNSGTLSASPSNTPASTSPSHSPNPQQPTLYAFRVSVAFGAPGDVTRRKGLQLGKFLPSQTRPMVVFIGASENLKHALFLVTDDVSAVSGDGRCVPGRNDCKLLQLKVGDEAKLAYAPEGDATYKLRLLAVDLAPIEAKAGSKQGKGPSAAERAPLGVGASLSGLARGG